MLNLIQHLPPYFHIRFSFLFRMELRSEAQ